MVLINMWLCLLVMFASLSLQRLLITDAFIESSDDDPLGLLLQPIFLDYSHFCNVVSFNKNLYTFSMFLVLQSGDIALNPGPAVIYPCSVCREPVNDSNKAMCCDDCDNWVHVRYDGNITEDIYDNLVINPTSNLWYWNLCIQSHSFVSCKPSFDHLTCICANVRSILPKKYNLFSYIIAHNIDIHADTECFLDSSVSDREFVPTILQCFHKIIAGMVVGYYC